MQTSQVFNQREWPGALDVDDCWVVSSIQAVNATMPWLKLVPVPVFRAAAGKPDRPNVSDGGKLEDVVRGIVGTWPVLQGRLKVLAGVQWAILVAQLDAGRPVTVAVKSMYLPPALQYGFGGYHQVTLAKDVHGRYLFANPLAPVYSAWDVLGAIDDVKEAVLRYGADIANARLAYGVALPTDAEAVKLHPGYSSAVAQLQAQYDELKKVTFAAKDDAAAAEEALHAFIAAVSL